MGFGKQIEYKNEEGNKQNDITTFTFTIPIIKILKKTFERIKTLEHN